MSQLPLQVLPRLSYSEANFIHHAGVRDSLNECLNCIGHTPVVYFYGPLRSGKTHLAIVLATTLARLGRYPQIIEGSQLAAWIATRLIETTTDSADEVILVDNAQEYFLAALPGTSGPFVSLIERFRKARSTIVFLSSIPIEDLPCDAHIMSRLHPGNGFQLKDPAEKDMPLILQSLATQRGLKLTPPKIEYLSKRLSREIGVLEAYMDRLVYLSTLTKGPIDFALLSDAMEKE